MTKMFLVKNIKFKKNKIKGVKIPSSGNSSFMSKGVSGGPPMIPMNKSEIITKRKIQDALINEKFNEAIAMTKGNKSAVKAIEIPVDTSKAGLFGSGGGFFSVVTSQSGGGGGGGGNGGHGSDPMLNNECFRDAFRGFLTEVGLAFASSVEGPGQASIDDVAKYIPPENACEWHGALVAKKMLETAGVKQTPVPVPSQVVPDFFIKMVAKYKANIYTQLLVQIEIK